VVDSLVITDLANRVGYRSSHLELKSENESQFRSWIADFLSGKLALYEKLNQAATLLQTVRKMDKGEDTEALTQLHSKLDHLRQEIDSTSFPSELKTLESRIPEATGDALHGLAS